MGENLAGSHAETILVLMYTAFAGLFLHFVFKIFRNRKDNVKLEEPETNSEQVSVESSSEEKSSDVRSSGKSKKRTAWKSKSEFSHPWLLKNLKGHPGTVLHGDFSANGKFMAATCDEAVPTSEAAARRRKPRERRRPPAAPPSPPPPRISVDELAEALRPHLLTLQELWTLGYPYEIEPNSCKAAVYVNPPPRPRPYTTFFDVNAPEFVPSGGSQSDSGRGSCGSSPRSDSDEEADAVEHFCVRCDSMFRMTRDGEYLTEEPCLYHWGRSGAERRYSCCGAPPGTRGCSAARLHVWSGTRPGMNGPLDGYVRARSPRGGVYAIDTEMCYTTAGLELASIAVVAADGRLVYRALVRPSSPVVDHNTRFSGIRPRDLARATKTLKDVQNDILGFVGTDTILIGHALDNDLRALKLLHGAVVDTCVMYPHVRGLPLRRSLRALAAELLGRSVQRGMHSPLEDARAAMDLVLRKVREQRRPAPMQSTPTLGPFLQPYDPLLGAA